MCNCWMEDSQQRPTFAHLVQHIADMLEQEAGYLSLRLADTLLVDRDKENVHKSEMEEGKKKGQGSGLVELKEKEHEKVQCETVM